MSFHVRLGGVIALSLSISTMARGATVGYSLEVGGPSFNVPAFRLSNTSTSLSVIEFIATIGDTAFNFDFTRAGQASSPGLIANLVRPDSEQRGVRADDVNYLYTGFAPGQSFAFGIDLDPDSINKRVDFRTILFDVGGDDESDNALITVRFSDNTVLSGTLPEFGSSEPPFVFDQSIQREDPEPAPIPLPQGLWAGLSLLGGLGALKLARNMRRLF